MLENQAGEWLNNRWYPSVGAAEGCDLLTLNIKRSQPSAAPTSMLAWRRPSKTYRINFAAHPEITLGRGCAYVRTLDVDNPRRTSDSATVTAALTPSITGTPVR